MITTRNETSTAVSANTQWFVDLYKAHITKSMSLNEQNSKITNYAFIQPKVQNQDTATLTGILSSLNHQNMNYVMCSDIDEEMYASSVAQFIPKWKMKILGLQNVSASIIRDLFYALDFSNLETIGVQNLGHVQLLCLYSKLLTVKYDNITIVCGQNIPPYWQQEFAAFNSRKISHADLTIKNHEALLVYLRQLMLIVDSYQPMLKKLKLLSGIQKTYNDALLKIKTLEESQLKLNAVNTNLHNQIKPLNEKIGQCEREKEQLNQLVHKEQNAHKTTNSKVLALTAEINILKQKITSIKSKAKQTEKSKDAEIEALMAQLVDAKQIAEDNEKRGSNVRDSLRQELFMLQQSLNNDKAQLKQELIGLQQSFNNERMCLEEKLADVALEAGTFSTANRELQMQVKNLQDELTTSKWLNNDAELAETANSLHEQINTMQATIKKLENERIMVANLQKQINELESKATAEKSHSQEIMLANTKLTSEKDALIKCLEEKNNQITLQQNYTDNMAKELDDLYANNELLTSDQTDLRVKKQELEDKVSTLEKKVSTLQELNTSLSELTARKAWEKIRLTKSNGHTSTNPVGVPTQSDRKRKSSDEMRTENKKLKDELTSCSSSLLTNATTIALLTAENVRLKLTAETRKVKLADSGANFRISKTVVSRNKRVIERLTQELNTEKANAAKWKEKAASLEASMNEFNDTSSVFSSENNRLSNWTPRFSFNVTNGENTPIISPQLGPANQVTDPQQFKL